MIEQKIKLPQIKDFSTVARSIGDFVVKNTLTTGSTGCVIGLSGGVDSTVTGALITKAYDTHNKTNPHRLELVGYILPSKINSSKDAEDGERVARRLGIRFETVNIEYAVEGFKTTNPEAFESQFHKGNLISEVRAAVLHRKGAVERKSVAGTGNKDEDFGLGYYTLFGDGAVHLSPIAILSKRNVRAMARHLGFSYVADREPSAGLEPGQTDFKDLGYGYDLVELVTEGFVQGISAGELYGHSQIVPVAENDIETYRTVFRDRKFSHTSELVDDILGRHHKSAMKKVKIVHPPSPEIELQYV